MRIGLLSLGCDKNTVDSERYVAEFVGHGAELAADLDDADVIVVNTCGFVDAAKQESIDALVEAGRRKMDGACQAVVAVGCLVERHKAELQAELPEVDLFLGASEMRGLVPALEARGLLGGGAPLVHPGVRIYTGDLPHVRYLKVSEGCDHGCAFCAIPLMRGRHRSFAVEEIVREAQLLEAQGAREVNLVAQDLAHFGRDRRDGVGLPELLERLLAETGIPWFRLLYLYSAGITPRLLELMAREPRVLPYVDMPMQHASDAVLARMRRPERERTIRERVARLRAVIPDVAIRTTCIVGFPGETDADFEKLLSVLGELAFERVGAFTYSAQEGTRAAALPDDVPDALKRERLERLEEHQRPISAERYGRHVGRVVRVVVDRAAVGAIAEDAALVEASAATRARARTIWQADDVDGVTWLDASAPTGAFCDVQLQAVVDDYDYEAHLLRVVSAPPEPRAPSDASPARPARALPVLAGISGGSYGR